MAIIEYFKSLLAALGVSGDRLPLVVGLIAAAIALLYARPFFARLGRIIEAVFLRNWQLGLLGSTGIVLSMASGWTTWDGMKNFTGEPILSAMVTFGIQGVMLIVAWLIGESFATGMNQQAPAGRLAPQGVTRDTGLKSALGLTLAGIALAGSAGVYAAWRSGFQDAGRFATWLAIAGGALIVTGVLIVAARAHTFRGYFDATRVILRTGVLWVMFLACMATSVFFSFDSLFSTIFPASERVRAAELRAQNQVAGIINDIGTTITTGQLKETEALFGTKAWIDYEKVMTKLIGEAGTAEKEIQAYYERQIEERKTAKAAQQERIATANSGSAGLINKKSSITDELARLRAERPALSEDFSKRKGDVEQIMKDLDAKRVEAMAESRGVEGSLKSGEGPVYRQRKSEEAALNDKLKIAQERLKDAQKRFQTTEARLTQIERELSLIDGDIAKLKGEAETAEQRIKLQDAADASGDAPKIDPARHLLAFQKVLAEFRQAPKAEGLVQIQSICNQLVAGMSATPATKDKVRGIDCDPKTAAEAAARVFALNAGIVAFDTQCAGGDKLARYKSADDLFGFARKCVQDSGLASKDTDDLRQKINFIELNRDDKANRFVVTWNAFQDGNRLAYLALAIAIAVDGLVFMSGLFGANAVRSPLSDVPTNKARSAEQLEGIIDNALLPHKFENARIAIEAMHADTSVPGYTAVVDLRELDPAGATVVRRVLNAGATIGAVLRNPDEPTQYAIRPELYEYLAITGARAFEKHGKLVQEDVAEKVRQGELEKMVRVALLPDEIENADTVLHYAHPMNEHDGFMSQIILREVEADHVRVVRRVLNAGAAHGAVRIQKGTDEQGNPHPYELHADLYKTLSKIRARMLLGTSPGALRIGQQPREGGALRDATPQIASRMATRSLPDGRAPEARGKNFDFPQELQAPDTRGNAKKPQGREPMGAADIAEFNRELCEHFAREMLGFQADSIAYVRDQSPVIDIPALENALGNVMRYDDQLRSALQQAKSGLENSIEAARDSFDGFVTGPADAPSRLNALADTLKRATAVMVLMPGQAYGNVVHKMMDELDKDHGEGRLDAYKSSQRDLLHRHVADLELASRSADHWQAIVASLNAFGRGMASLAARADLGQGRARMG